VSCRGLLGFFHPGIFRVGPVKLLHHPRLSIMFEGERARGREGERARGFDE
jgi:hypothetical protein